MVSFVRRCLLVWLLLAAVVPLAGCRDAGKPQGAAAPSSADGESGAKLPGQRRLSLVMIPKGTQQSFWNAVRAGAEKAQAELDVDLLWKGPPIENDRASQKQTLQQFLDKSVDGILLAPSDSRAMTPDVRAAMEGGTPVVIFDSALEGELGKDYEGLVSTDNFAAGKVGGEQLIKLVGEGAKVILFRHQEGHDSTAQREAGALEAFAASKADVLEKDRYSGESASRALDTALNMIDVVREAQGVFASNQTATEGMLAALRQTGLTGKVKLVGFDSSPLLVDAVRKGEIEALVVQDPQQIGYLSVKMLVAKLRGEQIPPFVEIKAHLVTKDNVNDPEISRLFQK